MNVNTLINAGSITYSLTNTKHMIKAEKREIHVHDVLGFSRNISMHGTYMSDEEESTLKESR